MFDVVADLTFTKPAFKLAGTLLQSAHTVASRRISLQLLGLGKERDKEEELGWEQENTSHMTGKRLERSDGGGGI
jgi:hypothetical protein